MELYILFGWLSWWVLIAILLLRPIAQIFRWKLLGKFLSRRKELGILCGIFALLHAGIFFLHFQISLSIMIDPLYWNFNTFYPWGFLGIFFLLFPFLSSNRWSQKLLKRRWKWVQRLSYPAFLFTGIHIYLVKEEFLLGLAPIILWGILWSIVEIQKHIRHFKRHA